MQPCYFWISVTFGPSIVYVITGETFLVIIKHITGPKQCKTALTSFIIRVVLHCCLFSVHLVRGNKQLICMGDTVFVMSVNTEIV